MIKNFLLFLIFSIITLFLFHFETISIAGINIGVMYKSLIIFFLIGYSYLYILKNNNIEKYQLWGTLFSIKSLINLSTFNYFMSTFSLFTQTFSLFIFTYTLPHLISKNNLLKLVKFMSIFVILSFIPYMIGILDTLGRVADMSAYGAERFGLLGPFQNPHSSSISLAVSIIVLSHFIEIEKNKSLKILFLLILFLGFFELLRTYIRTGLVMVMIGYFYMYLWNRSISFYLKITPFLLIGIYIIMYIYYSDPIWQNRLADKNIYSNQAIYGSGRLMFISFAIENWLSEGFVSWIIGLGTDYGKDLMKLDIGSRLFAHNGYIQIIQSDGIIGIFLYIITIFYIYKYIRLFKENNYYRMTMTLLLIYLTEMMLQGGTYMLLFFYFSSFIVLLSNKSS
jgi:hypothetical protein